MTAKKRGRKPRDMGEGSIYADIALLYGVSLTHPEQSKPKFGSSILVSLTGFDEPVSPTYRTLTEHFGGMQWVEDGIKNVIRGSRRGTGDVLDRRFIYAARKLACEQFEQQYIIPVRRQLEQQELYLYAVPQVLLEDDFSLDNEGGSRSEPQYLDRVICLLPATADFAKRARMGEEDIRLIAPQVLYVMKVRAVRGKIKRPTDLITAINGWIPFIDYSLRQQTYETLERSAPCLLTPQTTLKLLPERSALRGDIR